METSEGGSSFENNNNSSRVNVSFSSLKNSLFVSSSRIYSSVAIGHNPMWDLGLGLGRFCKLSRLCNDLFLLISSGLIGGLTSPFLGQTDHTSQMPTAHCGQR